MYPRTLLEADVKSKAEIKVFDRLRDRLPDEWEAYHSVSWIVRDHAEGSKDGEIDFVLCHPEQGILCLEVKGGGIECEYGEWHRSVDGKRERMKDPFTQAIDHAYGLRRKIAEVDGWKKGKLFITHALAFPDITVHELAMAPDAPAEIIIDRNGVEEIETELDRVLAFHLGSRDKREMPGEQGATMLRELLAPTVKIEVPMAADFLDEEEALVELTYEQSALLNRFGRDTRMAVVGCAGSGKTMLAIEQAKRLAAKDKDVLFVCFNKALLGHLKRRERKSGVDFFTFHGLCHRLAQLAKLDLPKYERGEAPPEFFTEDLPLALEEAAEELGPMYDAIYVDEAQDLENSWLEALTSLLRDPENDPVWLFMDDNQRVYEATLDVPKEFRPFDLTVNCRNTQAIHREVMKKYKGEVIAEVRGPEGRPVELFETADQPGTVARLIEEICGKGEVPPQDVVVLSAHGFDTSAVRQAGAGDYEYVREPKPVGKEIRFSSIRGFKGLESPVVILCELEDLDEDSRDQQLYVGLSRARNHCVVVAPG